MKSLIVLVVWLGFLAFGADAQSKPPTPATTLKPSFKPTLPKGQTYKPSPKPTFKPSYQATAQPTSRPTSRPTARPTSHPTKKPVTSAPTVAGTAVPTSGRPTTAAPSAPPVAAAAAAAAPALNGGAIAGIVIAGLVLILGGILVFRYVRAKKLRAMGVQKYDAGDAELQGEETINPIQQQDAPEIDPYLAQPSYDAPGYGAHPHQGGY